MIKTRKGTRRISQGDIFKNIECVEYIAEKSGIIEVSKIVFPLVVVLTQDCDLEQDYNCRWLRRRGEIRGADTNQDKWLFSVLVAPVYNARHVYLGEHLSELKMKMQEINSKRSPGKYLRENNLPRYHYLEFQTDIPIVESIIDFKHYFSVNVSYLHQIKKTNFVCSISELYRENLSQRFSNFLSRIGLPEPV